MKFYNDTKPLYLETNASGVGLGVALLQTCKGTTCQKDTVPNNTILHTNAFASKSITGAEHRFSNIERKALFILHGLEKFHHYCRLAVMTQPWRRERWTHQRYGYRSRCHTKHNRHSRMHLHFKDSTHNDKGWTFPMSKKHYNYRLAKLKRWASHGHKTILVL